MKNFDYDKIECNISRVVERSQSITHKDLQYLFKAVYLNSRTYHSHTCDRTQRLNYILNTLHNEAKDSLGDEAELLVLKSY